MPDMTVKQIADTLNISKEWARKLVKNLPPELVYLEGKTTMVTEEGVSIVVGTNANKTNVDTKTPTNSVGTNKENVEPTRVRPTNKKSEEVGRLVTTLEEEVAYLKEQIVIKDEQIKTLMDALQTAQKISALVNGQRTAPIQIEGEKKRRSIFDRLKGD